MSQTEEYVQTFKNLDTKKLGYLTEDQLKGLLQGAGHDDDDKFQAMFRAFDDNEDKQISMDEFVSTMLLLTQAKKNKAAARKIFKVYDLDNNGKLDYSEMGVVLADLKKELPNNAYRKIKEMIRKNADHMVPYEQFLSAFED